MLTFSGFAVIRFISRNSNISSTIVESIKLHRHFVFFNISSTIWIGISESNSVYPTCVGCCWLVDKLLAVSTSFSYLRIILKLKLFSSTNRNIALLRILKCTSVSITFAYFIRTLIQSTTSLRTLRTAANMSSAICRWSDWLHHAWLSFWGALSSFSILWRHKKYN